MESNEELYVEANLLDLLEINPVRITRFKTGYCHRVFHVIGHDGRELVLRLTAAGQRDYYEGCLQWLPRLYELGIKVPRILRHGIFGNSCFVLMTYLPGKDLGMVYDRLNRIQKQQIAGEMAKIQRKVATLPAGSAFGYSLGPPHEKWSGVLNALLERSSNRIASNSIFDSEICDKAQTLLSQFESYFSDVTPTPFLDDITTKNVLIADNRLIGIVDIDEVCYGDPLLTVGLTNMSLLVRKQENDYINYWLDAMNASSLQHQVLDVYTLLFCIDFMSEQGMTFGNGISVPASPERINCLREVYDKLLTQCGK